MNLILITLFISNYTFAIEPNNFKNFEISQENRFKKLEFDNNNQYSQTEKNIYTKWNELVTSSRKTLVTYYEDNNIRLIIDYEKGIVNLESIGKSKSDLKSVLNKVIDENGSIHSLLSLEELTTEKLSKSEIINRLMEKLSSDKISDETDLTNTKTKLSFSMLSDQLKIRAKRYLGLITKWAKINELEPELVLAIIRQESAFNPRAESTIPAYGLMQIVPKYAGRDIMITVMEHDEIPTKENLFDPEGNLFFGTSYIKLLKAKFNNFTDDKGKIESLVIAAYNWGPQRILNAIKDKRLNFEKPDLYGQIMKIAPTETKNYLKSVTEFKKTFQTKG